MKRKPPLSPAQYEARARIVKALAHPSRLLIVDVLEDGERCVCDLTELIGADQSTVSKHLTVMRQAGLIQDRKEGVMTFYRLKVPCLKGLWQCVEKVLARDLKERQEQL